MSRSHCGRIEGCGRNWSPYMLRPERHLILQRPHRHDRAVLGRRPSRRSAAASAPRPCSPASRATGTRPCRRPAPSPSTSKAASPGAHRRVAAGATSGPAVRPGRSRRPRGTGRGCSHGECVLNSSIGQGATPTEARKSLCSASSSSCWRWYSSRKACHWLRSSTGRPDSTGGRVGVAHLQRVRRHEPHPRRAGQLDRGIPRDVVGHDHVGPHVVPDLHDRSWSIARRPPAPPRSASSRSRSARSWACANSGAVTRMNSAHGSASGSAFSSGGAIRISRSSNPRLPQLALERLVDDEHDPMAALLQHVGDRDAVVRRAPRAGLGEERDRLAIGHRSLLVSNGGNLSFPGEGCPLRPSGRCAWFSRV